MQPTVVKSVGQRHAVFTILVFCSTHISKLFVADCGLLVGDFGFFSEEHEPFCCRWDTLLFQGCCWIKYFTIIKQRDKLTIMLRTSSSEWNLSGMVNKWNQDVPLETWSNVIFFGRGEGGLTAELKCPPHVLIGVGIALVPLQLRGRGANPSTTQ